MRRRQGSLTWVLLTHWGDSRKEREEASGGLTWLPLTHCRDSRKEREEESGGPHLASLHSLWGLQEGMRGGVSGATPGFSTEAKQARRE